ncbi:MAG: hypothetical protein HY898_19575 [Deltaproteobacteria bacterium]|nr:hypothetical protein [Deltaproteobacteria bacterium]
MSPRSRSLARHLIAIALSTGLVLAAFSALADRPSSDRAVATQILAQLQSDSSPVASAVARPTNEARAALARADNAVASGDAVNARLLEGLAREWAELAVDVARSVEGQQEAGALQSAAADASLRVQRARAMLDELAARKARAQGELNQLTQQADAGPAPVTTTPATTKKPASKPVIAVPPGQSTAAPKPGAKKGGGK